MYWTSIGAASRTSASKSLITNQLVTDRFLPVWFSYHYLPPPSPTDFFYFRNCQKDNTVIEKKSFFLPNFSKCGRRSAYLPPVAAAAAAAAHHPAQQARPRQAPRKLRPASHCGKFTPFPPLVHRGITIRVSFSASRNFCAPLTRRGPPRVPIGSRRLRLSNRTSLWTQWRPHHAVHPGTLQTNYAVIKAIKASQTSRTLQTSRSSEHSRTSNGFENILQH